MPVGMIQCEGQTDDAEGEGRSARPGFLETVVAGVGTGSGPTSGELAEQRQGLRRRTRGGAASAHTDDLWWVDGRGARLSKSCPNGVFSQGSKVINQREWLCEVK